MYRIIHCYKPIHIRLRLRAVHALSLSCVQSLKEERRHNFRGKEDDEKLKYEIEEKARIITNTYRGEW